MLKTKIKGKLFQIEAIVFINLIEKACIRLTTNV